MQQTIQEYTPGQHIRAEAVSLHHNGTRMAEILRNADIREEIPEGRLVEIAAAASAAVRKSPKGEFTGIDRRRNRYEELEEMLEENRPAIEKMRVSEDSRSLWLILNKCQYHCRMIISLMEMYSR